MNFAETSEEESYTFIEVANLKLRLIPEHSLWGHVLFNASTILGNYLKNYDLTNKTVLELGSGSGYLSISAAKQGAIVTATDFPEQIILSNISYNAKVNDVNIEVQPLLFGGQLHKQYDFVILSDCIQIIAEHNNILKTILLSSRKNTKIIISYQVHQPDKAQQQLNFLNICENQLKIVKKEVVKCERQFVEDDNIYEATEREYCTIWECELA